MEPKLLNICFVLNVCYTCIRMQSKILLCKAMLSIEIYFDSKTFVMTIEKLKKHCLKCLNKKELYM